MFIIRVVSENHAKAPLTVLGNHCRRQQVLSLSVPESRINRGPRQPRQEIFSLSIPKIDRTSNAYHVHLYVAAIRGVVVSHIYGGVVPIRAMPAARVQYFLSELGAGR